MSFIVELSFFVIGIGCALLYYVNNKSLFKKNGTSPDGQQSNSAPFLKKYLVMYVFAVGADWIQGPYAYDLYVSLGFSWRQITSLYMTSFLSSAVSGTFLGAMSDWVGHRISALGYCAIYATSALLKTSSSLFLQVCSSMMGGIAGTLLYTVFDSWLVSEHNSVGASSSALSHAFSLESALSSVTAIVAGILCSVLVDQNGGLGLGPKAPFVTAALILVPCAVCVLRTMHPKAASYSSANSSEGIKALLHQAWSFLSQSKNARLVCATQAFFESAMYIFVVLWTPVIRGQCKSSEDYLSTIGWIFSAFMAAMTTGSQVYAYFTSKHTRLLTISSVGFAVATISLFVPTLFELGHIECAKAEVSSHFIFFSFVLFESVCGLYYPVINDLKARFFPSEFRTGLMSISRVGQNIIITSVLLSSDMISNAFMLFIASMTLLAATIVQQLFSENHDAPMQQLSSESHDTPKENEILPP